MKVRGVLLLIIVLLFSPVLISPQSQEIYIQRLEMDWASAFSEPFEILYLIMYDTSGFGLTTMQENQVRLGVAWLVGYLAEEGYEVSDIAIMVHNHLRDPHFSWGNGMVLKQLRERGFDGSFGLYHSPSGKITWADR